LERVAQIERTADAYQLARRAIVAVVL
jgi:hypothetical protein